MVGQHVNVLLGRKVKDKVTGTIGVVSSISFDLYGCIQVVLTENLEKHHWLDITRVEVLDNVPVMQLPKFDKGYVAEGRKGAAPKPCF
jgi:hypothetical protein